VEILNGARAAAYVKAFLPQVEVRCAYPELGEALGHSGYWSPEEDGAPWYAGDRPAAAGFYGLFPGKVTGAEDSTRSVEVTELTGSGAVLTSPRHGSREIRYVATAFAADEEAMEEGMAWLRQVLAHDGCSDADPVCAGTTAQMFAAAPADALAAADLDRTFHRVEVSEGPLVTRKHPVTGRSGVKWELEFTLTAGTPWAFTATAHVGVLAMDAGTNFQDPAGEDCSVGVSGYDEFVADPFFTAISRPPRPPVILPPNILNITSWRRLTLPIPAAHTSRWGRTVPVVHVATESAIQYLRLRFYRDGAAGCGFDAEVIVSYLPASAVLTLDAITRTATLKLSDGREVPAGNLLFGSAGRPFVWASLGCQHNYTLTADLMPGQPGAVVILDTAVRL
jgi:hypothetical protein